jgi:hypothetical protein
MIVPTWGPDWVLAASSVAGMLLVLMIAYAAAMVAKGVRR